MWLRLNVLALMLACGTCAALPRLGADEAPAAGGQSPPQLDEISQRGLQIGRPTAVTIKGKHLSADARVVLSGVQFEQSRLDESTDDALRVELRAASSTVPGIYPLRVHTSRGISNWLALAIDALPQAPAAGNSPDQPAALPVAFSGTIAGAARPRMYFRGRAGQRLVADVEARRLGATMQPVVELQDARGVALMIGWRMPHLGGDTRVEYTLPEDGIYSVQLHDLRYKAPGKNPFRIKVGDLTIVDALFPPAVRTDSFTMVRPIGTGPLDDLTIWVNPRDWSRRAAGLVSLPAELQAAAPLPVLQPSESIEYIEAPRTGETAQQVRAMFTEQAAVPVVINGRLLEAGEQDEYLVEVQPQQKIDVSVAARAFDSPLDAELSVHRADDDEQLARGDDQAGTHDPAVELTVPEGVTLLRVRLGDLHGRGGPHFIYRLRFAPASQPDFTLRLLTREINLPQRGTALVEFQVTRSGYNGPIKLEVVGSERVSIEPAEIRGAGRFLATLISAGESTPGQFGELQIVGSSAGDAPAIRETALLNLGTAGALPGHQDMLPLAVTSPLGVSLAVSRLPSELLKGLDSEVEVRVERAGELPSASAPIRLSLVSTESNRPANVFAPQQGSKPLVRIEPEQTVGAEEDARALKLLVPTDVAQKQISFVLRGELVTADDPPGVLGTIYSAPFRLAVQDAVVVEFEDESLQLVSETKTQLRGKVQRRGGFQGALEITLNELPQVYQVEKTSVAADEEAFELTVTPQKFNEEIDLPLSRLIVTAQDGGAQLVNQQLKIKLLPMPAGT